MRRGEIRSGERRKMTIRVGKKNAGKGRRGDGKVRREKGKGLGR